jgi:hypothetical protein
VIVRIATEGQFELDQADYEAVNDLDNRVVEAVEAGDEAQYKALFGELIEHVRSKGRKLGDDELSHSDVILPPHDTTLEEAAEEFTGEGVIPESLMPGSVACASRNDGAVTSTSVPAGASIASPSTVKRAAPASTT